MQKSALGYAGAVGAVIVALVLRWLADPYLGDHLPLVTMFGAVAVAAWIGGLRPGILAMVLGYLLAYYFFVAPRFSLRITTARDLIGLLAFLLTSGFIIAMGEAVRVGERRLRDLTQRQERWFSPSPRSELSAGRYTLLDPAILGLLLAIVVLGVGGFAGYGSARHMVENEKQVAHTHQVINALETFLSTLKDAETGQRGFILTEKDEYLEPYYDGVRRVTGQLDQLKELVSDNPEQMVQVLELKGVTERKLMELERSIALARQKERAQALALVRSDSGQVLMAGIRRSVSDLQNEERALLERRAAESRESYRIAVVSIVLPAILGVILVGCLTYLIQRRLTERKMAALLLADQRERYRVTLASIGDGVITTDIEGRVTYLNPVAEVATGWTTAEAYGADLGKIFQIVNEETRLPVQNPATRALQEGTVVGLANHTILIRKDGSECPIDDSAAPIRDEEGRVNGCVLIFRDITERKAIEKRSADSTAAARFLASIVDSSEDAIIAVSLNGTIQTWNGAAERLYGYSAREAVGKPISILIPADRADEEDRLIARLLSGERITHFDTVRLKRNGQTVDVSLTLSAVRDENDRIIGTSKMVRDISETKAAEKRIYGLMADLKDADRRKDEFLAILAHELRGPLAPIRHSLEIIKRTQGNGEILRTASTTMDRQLTQMVRLVDDLLDVSRITRNKLELRRERVNLNEVLEQAIQICQPFAESLRHRVSVEIDPEPIFVNGDPVRLAQVFTNLIQNAYKYTEHGGSIWLTARREGSEVRVSVKDTGVGIPPDLLPRIFDLFIQVERSLERSQGGLGIGLTLVKQLVAMHEGTVSASSDGPGRGSEFVVRLPVMVETQVSHPLTPSTPIDPGSIPRRILVVDDNRDSVESLAILLRMLGHETHLAYDGLAAYQAAERIRPELILLDIGLPKLNGYDACRKIREQEWGQSIVIVALSGWGQQADRRKSEEAGFNHHLVKPLDYNILMDILASLPNSAGQSAART